MSESKSFLPPDCLPDISDLAIDDDEPVDSVFHERQHRLLVDSLYGSWEPGRTFVALTDVGLFYSVKEPPYVPDVMVTLDITWNPDLSKKENLSYFTWIVGKPPDLVVEVVSHRTDRHEEAKILGYARLGIGHYVIYDPFRKLGRRELRVYELHGGQYVELLNPGWIPFLSLGVKVVDWDYQGVPGRYMRWCDRSGNLLLTHQEQVENHKRQLGEQQQTLAEQEQTLAEQQLALADREQALAEERSRREALEARLRELEG